MRNRILWSILFILVIFLFSCNQNEGLSQVQEPSFIESTIWDEYLVLLKDTEGQIQESSWEELTERSPSIAEKFSSISEKIETLDNVPVEFHSVSELQSENCSTAAAVFQGDVSDIDNINTLTVIDQNMSSIRTAVQHMEEDFPTGFFTKLSEDTKTAEYLLKWGTRVAGMIEKKILTEKEIQTEEDIETVKRIVAEAEEENRLDELQDFLLEEAAQEKQAPSVLFSLSVVYGRKGLVQEEYKAIENLERKVKKTPNIAFNLALVYGRKETLKSQIEKAEAEALALTQGSLSVQTIPDGAEIYLSGTKMGESPLIIEDLSEGSYPLQIHKELYKPIESTVQITAQEQAVVSKELSLIPGSLTITTQPTESIVYLDGEEFGVSPLEMNQLEPGAHQVKVQKDNYNEKEIAVEIEPGKSTVIDLELEALTGKISVFKLNEGAVVYLDGEAVDTVESEKRDIRMVEFVPIGEHTVLIHQDNYKDRKYNITVEKGETSRVFADLEKLVFRIPFAEIDIDGDTDDWEDLEPFIIDPAGDNSGEHSGTDIERVYLAQNDSYLFVRMDFADGKPKSFDNLVYEVVMSKGDHGKPRLEIRLQQNDRGFEAMAFNNGSTLMKHMKYKIGRNFFEARYTLSRLPDEFLDAESSVSFVRCWRVEPRSIFDLSERRAVSFAYE